MKEAVYRVLPHEGDWCIEYQDRVLGEYGTQEMAVLGAAEHARARPPARVVVLDADGTVLEDTPYTDDFRPPPAQSDESSSD